MVAFYIGKKFIEKVMPFVIFVEAHFLLWHLIFSVVSHSFASKVSIIFSSLFFRCSFTVTQQHFVERGKRTTNTISLLLDSVSLKELRKKHQQDIVLITLVLFVHVLCIRSAFVVVLFWRWNYAYFFQFIYIFVWVVLSSIIRLRYL